MLWLTILCWPQRLMAHATLLQTSPGAGARLEQPPARIELVFNERIEAVFHSLEIVDSNGQQMQTGEASVADGGETLRVALPAAAPEIGRAHV